MAIIPPGNKQIGDIGAVAILSKLNVKYLDVYGLCCSAVFKSTEGNLSTPVNKKLITDVAAMVVCSNNVKTINTTMLAMAAVFKYLPPTKISIHSAALQSVFIKPVDYTLVKLKRTFILDLGLQGLIGSKQPRVTCSNLAIQGVFRYASPRIETIIMNLKYPIMV